MLNVYFGPMPEAIYNTAVYFKNTYEDKCTVIGDGSNWHLSDGKS